ncbi:hypothetical protein GCM10008968_31950 [Bacillus horti]
MLWGVKDRLELKEPQEIPDCKDLQESLGILGIPDLKEQLASLVLQVRLGIKGRRGTLALRGLPEFKE